MPVNTGLPDNLGPVAARKELVKELEAMTTDQIRARVRQLPDDKRTALKQWVRSVEKARKAELINGLAKVFGL